MKAFPFVTLLLFANSSWSQSNTIASGIYVWKSSRAAHEQILTGTTSFLEPLRVSVESMKPGEHRIPHRDLTDFEELLIIKEGNLTIAWDGMLKTIGPGSIVFLVPGDKRAVENKGSEDVVFYRLEYNAKSASDKDRTKSNGGSFIIDWKDLPFKATNVGGRRDFFNKATATTERFEMHVTTLNEGVPSHAPHEHDEEEIILLMKGKATMTVEGKEYLMGPGDFVFAASHDFHGIRNSGKGQCEYFAFQWK
jgi:(S)-ureidoglycine aminohydrolase